MSPQRNPGMSRRSTTKVHNGYRRLMAIIVRGKSHLIIARSFQGDCSTQYAAKWRN
jgi:hypothetical protein